MDKLGKILGRDITQGIMSRMLMADVKENETTSLTLAQTKANGTYVRMLDANGNTVKVARDTFIQAIRDLLPSVLTDQATNGKNFLTLLTDGTLGKTTLDNAASVLGGLPFVSMSIKDVLNIDRQGLYLAQGASGNPICANKPSDGDWYYMVSLKTHNASRFILFAIKTDVTKIYGTILNTTGTEVTWNPLM